jgi:hypothetical protein
MSLFLEDRWGGAGQVTTSTSHPPGSSSCRARLLGGCAGAVEAAGGGADVHVERDAVVGVAGHAGHVGDVQLPGEQGGGAEHVPQAVPGPAAVAAGVAPADLQVGAFEDVAVEVGGPPVLPVPSMPWPGCASARQPISQSFAARPRGIASTGYPVGGARATVSCPAGSPRRGQAPRLSVPTHPNPRYRKSLTALPGTSRFQSSPAARRSPAADNAPRDGKMTADQDPHKIPTPHTPHRTLPAPRGSSRSNTYPLVKSKSRKLPR